MSDIAAAKGLILSESRNLRFFSFFLLYFAQGIPYGLTVFAIPVWLAANGAPEEHVASLTFWAYIIWTGKFVVGALMDRYTYLPMGRRRSWLIGSQALITSALIGAAAIAPQVTDISALVIVAILVNAGAASQDVAVDGLAVDLLPEEEQGTASGFMFGGQAFGIAAATALGGFGLQFLGSSITFLLFIPIMFIPTIYAIVIKERPGEKRLPWSEGKPSSIASGTQTHSWISVERDDTRRFWNWNWDGLAPITIISLLRPSSIWFVLCQGCSRLASGICLPLLQILGTQYVLMETATYTSTLATIDLVMAFVGLVLGGWMALKLGARWATFSVQVGLAFLFLFVLFGQDIWIEYKFFVGVMIGWSLLTLLNSICSNPLRMQLSDKRVGATQFTIYNSLANLPVALGASLLIFLGGTDNLDLTLTVAIGLFATAAFGYALLRMPKVVEPEHVEHVEEAIGGEIPAKVD